MLILLFYQYIKELTRRKTNPARSKPQAFGENSLFGCTAITTTDEREATRDGFPGFLLVRDQEVCTTWTLEIQSGTDLTY